MEENSGNILNQEIVDILGTLTESEAESFEDAEKGKMVPYVMGCFWRCFPNRCSLNGTN